MSEISKDSDLENGHPNGAHKASPGPPQNDEDRPYRLPFLQWIEQRFSWSWFTCTQSTGGIAALLSESPKQFPGLETIGVIIFIFNIILFLLFTAFMAIRWYKNPSNIRKCFIHAPECYFFGSFWLSAATMIINTELYGVPHAGPWLIIAVRVLFWIYAAISLLNTTVHIAFIAQYTPFKAIQFAPPMFLIVLNAMLTGTVAAAIAMNQPPAHRVPIMVAGVGYQGLGWIACMIFLTLTFANLMENGWPAPNMRSGLFILTGTSGFTILALIGIARACPTDYGFFATHPTAPEVLLIVATWVGVFMWLFSLWVFGMAFVITALGVLKKENNRWELNISFTNVAWAVIFPNIGWCIATIYLGQELESEAILWVSEAMTILLVAFWLLDLLLMAKTIARSMFVDSRIKLG